LLKSENGNGGSERKCGTITIAGVDLTETQEQGKIKGLFDGFFLENA
jgi:hypothetical protein